MSNATPLPWLINAMRQLDHARTDEELLAATRSARAMLKGRGLSFCELAESIGRLRSPVFADDAPVTLATVRGLVADGGERLPLAMLPGLGAIAAKLRGGDSIGEEDIKIVQRARATMRGAA